MYSILETTETESPELIWANSTLSRQFMRLRRQAGVEYVQDKDVCILSNSSTIFSFQFLLHTYARRAYQRKSSFFKSTFGQFHILYNSNESAV